ncbi:hypothetical protein [Mycobacterium simiae]|uniref:hypothetical protein n=1 Tax=Mycobacterium simiae TaxID=1784 RepID=UPI00261A2DC6|nr:hypothetical protein [Mycobacterium simiae]
MSDELIRDGAHDRALGSDGFVIMALLLSRASTKSGQREWETSASRISEELGWGLNRERARLAIERAEKDGRLIRREFLRDGRLVPRRCTYVIAAGGRRLTDHERLVWSRPTELPATVAVT